MKEIVKCFINFIYFTESNRNLKHFLQDSLQDIKLSPGYLNLEVWILYEHCLVVKGSHFTITTLSSWVELSNTILDFLNVILRWKYRVCAIIFCIYYQNISWHFLYAYIHFVWLVVQTNNTVTFHSCKNYHLKNHFLIISLEFVSKWFPNNWQLNRSNMYHVLIILTYFVGKYKALLFWFSILDHIYVYTI